MPLTFVASLIDPATLDPLPPSAERVAFFTDLTKLPYVWSTTSAMTDMTTIYCPCCAPRTAQEVAWWTPKGDGYAQADFELKCPRSGKKFSRSEMGIRRFCDEVVDRWIGQPVYFS